MLFKKFSSRILELRMKNNLRQSDLAEKIGVTRATISKIESGRRLASMDVLVALSHCFRVSIDYIIGVSNDPTIRDPVIDDEESAALEQAI
jgi:transcriptional regulator with XRE-family HTH domain